MNGREIRLSTEPVVFNPEESLNKYLLNISHSDLIADVESFTGEEALSTPIVTPSVLPQPQLMLKPFISCRKKHHLFFEPTTLPGRPIFPIAGNGWLCVKSLVS